MQNSKAVVRTSISSTLASALLVPGGGGVKFLEEFGGLRKAIMYEDIVHGHPYTIRHSIHVLGAKTLRPSDESTWA